MKNKYYFIILTLFFILPLRMAYADRFGRSRVEPNKDYCQVPKNHVVLAYTADLGRKWIGVKDELIGQGTYDPALDLLKQEGYEVIDIFDSLNGGKFIKFKKAWEDNPRGIVLFNNHGGRLRYDIPSHVVIGMFDSFDLVREFLRQLRDLGYNQDDYLVMAGWYWAVFVTSEVEEPTDDDISWNDSWEQRIYWVSLTPQGLNKFRDRKDLVIWGPCFGEATQEHIPSNIVCFRRGTNFEPLAKESTRILMGTMSGDDGIENLAFTKAFKFMEDSRFQYADEESSLFGLIQTTEVTKYDYSGPKDGVDLVLNPYIKEIKYVDDSSAEIHFATKMRARDFGVGERPVYVQAGTANCLSAQVDYGLDLKPRWINEQTLRVTMNWGQCSAFPRWAKIIVRAKYFQAKDNPYFYLNGRRYVDPELRKHVGIHRGFRPLGVDTYVTEADFYQRNLSADDDWFWIVAYNDPNGKSGEIFNDFNFPHE